MTGLEVGDVVEWDTFAGSTVEVERGRVSSATPTELRTKCHRQRYRGRGAGTYYECELRWHSAEFDRVRKVGLPTPSTSATIDHSRPGLGFVTVVGYTPPHRVIDDESPRAYGQRKPRAKIICTRCLKPGHNASNTKHHPRPL